MSDHYETIYSEIDVWQRVSHENIVKIFEMFDDYTHEDMYLLMELAKWGQIQEDHDIDGSKGEDLVRMNPKVYDIAVDTSRKTWPGKDESDVEVAARWIF